MPSKKTSASKIKKIGLIFLAIVVGLAIIGFGVVVYSGLFTKVEIVEKQVGPWVMVYQEHQGSYSKVGPTMDQVYQELQDIEVEPKLGIGLYYDNPDQVTESALRSEVGSVVESVDLDKINNADLSSATKIKMIAAQPALVAEFPIKTPLSYIIGPMVVYKQLNQAWAEKGYDQSEYAIELYDMPNKKTLYIMPIPVGQAANQDQAGSDEQAESVDPSNTPALEPTVAPQHDWSSYQVPHSQLMFKHPQDWEREVVSPNQNFVSVYLKKDDLSQEPIVIYQEEMPANYSINIVVQQNKKKLTAKEHYLAGFTESARDQAAAELTEVTLAGLKGVKYQEGAAPASGKATVVLLADQDHFYRFTYSAMATQATHTKFLPVFEQLLETVKFAE
ncbi:MAG: hypothetical protein GF390_03415 [Candidatus Pacebacteria bacterium]|nr:hypothetical protein [Candidatus Paceibacterota bacterium]